MNTKKQNRMAVGSPSEYNKMNVQARALLSFARTRRGEKNMILIQLNVPNRKQTLKIVLEYTLAAFCNHRNSSFFFSLAFMSLYASLT